MARPAAIITGHRRSVSAPQAVNATAIGKRTGYAIGTSGSGTASRLSTTKRTNASQVPGAIANVTATIAAVAPSATARLRHSRRTAYHTSDTGTSFVRSGTTDHTGDSRMDATTAAAMMIWMFPMNR